MKQLEFTPSRSRIAPNMIGSSRSAHHFTEPSLPADQLELVKQEWLAGLEQQLSDPQSVAANALQRILSPWPKGHVRYVETTQEQIADVKAAKLDELRAFYRDFAGAGRGELVVIGDFDAAAVTPKSMPAPLEITLIRTRLRAQTMTDLCPKPDCRRRQLSARSPTDCSNG